MPPKYLCICYKYLLNETSCYLSHRLLRQRGYILCGFRYDHAAEARFANETDVGIGHGDLSFLNPFCNVSDTNLMSECGVAGGICDHNSDVYIRCERKTATNPYCEGVGGVQVFISTPHYLDKLKCFGQQCKTPNLFHVLSITHASTSNH